MKLAFSPGKEEQLRAGQLKLRSLFAIMALVSVSLAWHRQFGWLYEYNESPKSIAIFAIGLPLVFLVSGVWPKVRDAIFVVAPVVILVVCISCTLTTGHTLMQFAHSGGPTQYTAYGNEILWGSFLWGFGLPATLTCVAAAFEINLRELQRYKYSVLASAFSIFNTVAANLFAILILTTNVRDMDAFGAWLRQLCGISS